MRKIVLIGLVLVGIVAFAAEPTTSTEADMHDGRAHGAFFHSGSSAVRALHAARTNDDLIPSMPVALAALLALLLAAPRVATIVLRVPDDGSVPRWATRARRGPPAPV